jgi:3-deoxy-7-phosphoheptulonate synthase
MSTSPHTSDWSPESWKTKPLAHAITYPDSGEVSRAEHTLRSLPPLVTSWEIERLRDLIADAQQGKRFLLQGGDCAEMFAECRADTITNKLKILLQMSLVIVHGSRRPVIRVWALRRPIRQAPLQPDRNAPSQRRAAHAPQLFRRSL